MPNMWGKKDRSAREMIIVGDFNTPLSEIDPEGRKSVRT